MGEQADYSIEQGIDLLAMHQMGECGDDWCIYCYQEEEARAKRLREASDA